MIFDLIAHFGALFVTFLSIYHLLYQVKIAQVLMVFELIV